jgi:murein DD-endopeptidase MepM/ murein hydrolase activator NlpD
MNGPMRGPLVLVFVAVAAGFAGAFVAKPFYAVCAAVAVAAVGWSLLARRSAPSRWWERAVDPIVLTSPFVQPWRVVAGGPDSRHNAAHVAGEQYFAYDFAPVDGDALDCEVVSPCDGTVAWAEDGRNEARNYVSIETRGGYVILAHLRAGSMAVRLAGDVRAGTPVARCGGSHDGLAAHVHVHAQDRPQLAADIARPLPIAFADALGVAQVLEFGDVLEPAFTSEG